MPPLFRRGRLIDGVKIIYLYTTQEDDDILLIVKIQTCLDRFPQGLYTILKRCVTEKSGPYELIIADRHSFTAHIISFPLQKERIYQIARSFSSRKSVYRLSLDLRPQPALTTRH
jgi:hypothetical protein